MEQESNLSVNGGSVQETNSEQIQPEIMPVTVDVALAKRHYRTPGALDDKYTRGVALLAGGSERYPGAGLLNALGAAGTGVGLIRFVSSPRSTDLVLSRLPEVVLEVGRFQAALVGSGWDCARLGEAQKVVALAAELGVPLVVDAGALSFARSWLESFPGLQMVLTPHVREAANLLQVDPTWVAADLVRASQRLADQGFTVCLKAAATVVASPGGQVYRYRAANAWGAVAGAGDVLAGVITGLLAQRQADREREQAAGGSAQVGGDFAGASGQMLADGCAENVRVDNQFDNQCRQVVSSGEFALVSEHENFALAEIVAAAVWLHGGAAHLASRSAAKFSEHSASTFALESMSALGSASVSEPTPKSVSTFEPVSLAESASASVDSLSAPIVASQIASEVPRAIASISQTSQSTSETLSAPKAQADLPVPAAIFPLTARVDLDAVVANAKFFADLAPACSLMGVVKANGYGHGMLPVARALRLAGVSWFGVSHLDEAILLRQKLAEFDDSTAAQRLRAGSGQSTKSSMVENRAVHCLTSYSAGDSSSDDFGSSFSSSHSSASDSRSSSNKFAKEPFLAPSRSEDSLLSPYSSSVTPILGEYVHKPRILTWLVDHGQDLRTALLADLDLSVSNEHQLRSICDAAAILRARIASPSAQKLGDSQRQKLGDTPTHLPARIHLKVDVGMSRGGAQLDDLPRLVSQIASAQQTGVVTLEAVWGHLNCADDPDGVGAQITRQEIQVFNKALEIVQSAGLTPKLRHLAASSGALWHPAARFDLIRPGVGLYGFSPNPESRPTDTGALQPAMTLSSRLIQVKHLQSGQGVSYGATFVAERAQWVGLLPCGYGDGIARQASNRAPLWVNGRRSRILGRVCMDQIVIDLGEGKEPWAQPGDEVILFSSAKAVSLRQSSAKGAAVKAGSSSVSASESVDSIALAADFVETIADVADFPTADEWAKASDTINYTVTTCLPPHVQRVYIGQVANLLGLSH